MKFAQEPINSPFLIRSYEPGCLHIGDRLIKEPVLIHSQKFIRPWSAQINASETAAWLQYQPELVLIGTGQKQFFPELSALAPIIQAGIGYEIMDTAAACRTFNILLAEERMVLMALMI